MFCVLQVFLQEDRRRGRKVGLLDNQTTRPKSCRPTTRGTPRASTPGVVVFRSGSSSILMIQSVPRVSVKESVKLLVSTFEGEPRTHPKNNEPSSGSLYPVLTTHPPHLLFGEVYGGRVEDPD